MGKNDNSIDPTSDTICAGIIQRYVIIRLILLEDSAVCHAQRNVGCHAAIHVCLRLIVEFDRPATIIYKTLYANCPPEVHCPCMIVHIKVSCEFVLH